MSAWLLLACLNNWGNNWCAVRLQFESQDDCRAAVTLFEKTLSQENGRSWHCIRTVPVEIGKMAS